MQGGCGGIYAGIEACAARLEQRVECIAITAEKLTLAYGLFFSFSGEGGRFNEAGARDE